MAYSEYGDPILVDGVVLPPFATFMYSRVESIHESQSACGLCASAGR